MPQKETTPEQLASMAEDRDCIRRIVEGDKHAYRFLQKKYQRLIYSAVRRLIRADQDIEDIVQETFIKAYSALSSYKSEYAFSSWLYKIASNACIDHLRKRRLPTFSIDTPIGSGDGEYFVELRDDNYIPDAVLLQNERRNMIESALASLPEKYKIVMKLRHEDDLDYQQIADILQLPIGTVKAHLFRARKRLYDMLKQHNE